MPDRDEEKQGVPLVICLVILATLLSTVLFLLASREESERLRKPSVVEQRQLCEADGSHVYVPLSGKHWCLAGRKL